MLQIFTSHFLIISFTGALLAAISTSIFSVFISVKKISYMSNALAHVSFAGIAIAFLFGLNFTLISLIFVILVSIAIGIISLKGKINEADTTTIFLSVSMAIAIILINLNNNYKLDLASYLFGNILLITKSDLISIVSILIVNFVFLLLFFRQILYMSYNFEISTVYKIDVKFVYFAFLILLAANIVVTVKIVGIILITAQFILPGIIGLNFTRNIKKAILFSILFSLISTILGFFISFYLSIPSGATIVLVLFVIFLLSLLYKKYLSKMTSKTKIA